MATTNETGSDGFTAEERAAMKDRASELRRKSRAKTTPEQDAAEVAAHIASLPDTDRVLAERVHAVVMAAGPDLRPKTWYGSPAYYKDGKCLVFFQPASKFKTRYANLGFNEGAQLDDGDMWATAFAVLDVTPAVETRITELVRTAIG